MKHVILTIFFVLTISNKLAAQTIAIQPYLQDASPTSMTVMWQTDQENESIVLWGETPDLGNKTSGTVIDINFSKERVHEVKLTQLKRFTKYYYKVKTGAAISKVYSFKTPPFSNTTKPFNLVAMSDMQRDGNHPGKFKEVVEDGIITYVNKNFKGDIEDNLSLIMIPGDLVPTGTNFSQWEDYFFNPSKKLFSKVPVYPVPGNHEQNSDYFFNYFSLPKNGSPTFSEHWWYKDHANVRIIGLDSNKGYRNDHQLNWLKKVLEETAKNEDIDFVFAQLHHPHKSELWIPGEEGFTGKVVKMLETFTDKTNKPSIHFFGHTHGYSRGQSKAHKHLWVNVASAGGAIDNWGGFEGRDYDEFTVTQDEYGFVFVTVDPDATNPKFTLKRISRGNNIKPRDNEQRDEITIYKHNLKPQAPAILNPIDKTMPITSVVLKATNFISSKKDAFHAASQWQVSKSTDFSKPIFDSWKQYENWYYKENRQKDDDLTDERLNRLEHNTTYYIRVRYRDQFLNWSDWSTVSSFKTKKQ